MVLALVALGYGAALDAGSEGEIAAAVRAAGARRSARRGFKGGARRRGRIDGAADGESSPPTAPVLQLPGAYGLKTWYWP